MKEFKIPKRTLILWQIRTVLIYAILGAVSYFFSFKYDFFETIFIILSAFFLIVVALYLPKYYSLFKIKCLEDAVVVENGIFVKRCHILPFSRLIYSQTINTPLSKVFRVTAVKMKAARSFIFIPEILDSDVKEFLTILVKGDVL